MNEQEQGRQEQEYSSHREQLLAAQPPPERIGDVEASLIEAYKTAIVYREVPFIVFGDLDAEELTAAFVRYPIIIKPTVACVNVAQRAIKRDLGIDFDTYAERVPEGKARLLAGYLKPLLPPAIAVPALMELDRYFWTDKEMRSAKGRWEVRVTAAITGASGGLRFGKRMFEVDDETFELDAAYPTEGKIEIGIDVKRLESSRDLHKRSDEIVNKAEKFNKAYPTSKFATVVYFPFPHQHINLQSRLRSEYIVGPFFAGETDSSIASAAEMVVGALDVKKKEADQ